MAANAVWHIGCVYAGWSTAPVMQLMVASVYIVTVMWFVILARQHRARRIATRLGGRVC